MTRFSRFTPRFSAWNSDIRSLPKGKGWENAHPLPKREQSYRQQWRFLWNTLRGREHARRRIALHEVGHFLLHCAIGSAPFLKGTKSGRLGGYIDFNWEDLRKNLQTVLKQPSIDAAFNLALTSRAGCVLEHLIYGAHCNGNTQDEVMVNKEIKPVLKAVKKHGKDLPIHIKDQLTDFPNRLDDITQAHLQQYDRATVEALTDLLMKEGRWDRQRLGELIQQFDLENVPTAKEPVIEL